MLFLEKNLCNMGVQPIHSIAKKMKGKIVVLPWTSVDFKKLTPFLIVFLVCISVVPLQGGKYQGRRIESYLVFYASR